MTPKVSIIVPNYNHARFLKQRLESIYQQSYENFEVILLDDSSTDHSKDVLLQYKSHPKTSHFIISENNSGSPFLQWSKGIEFAKGEYVWIAEADDFCETDFLKKTLIPLLQDEKIAFAYCQSTRTNAKGDITGNWLSHTNEFKQNFFQKDFVIEGNLFIEKYLIHKNVVPNVSAVLFRGEFLKSIMPLDYEPFMRYNADWYFYIQLLCNRKVAFIAEPLNHFRYHENSVISRAGAENGWLKIFQMELKGRQKMLNFVDRCKPENLEGIIKEWKIGNNRLYLYIAENYIKRKKYWKAFGAVWDKPKLMGKVIRFFMRKTLYWFRKI